LIILPVLVTAIFLFIWGHVSCAIIAVLPACYHAYDEKCQNMLLAAIRKSSRQMQTGRQATIYTQTDS
jgi:hypothetical protein